MLDAAFACPCATHAGRAIALVLECSAFTTIAISTVIVGLRKRRTMDRPDEARPPAESFEP
jgi:hypothetical protein